MHAVGTCLYVSVCTACGQCFNIMYVIGSFQTVLHVGSTDANLAPNSLPQQNMGLHGNLENKPVKL